MVSAPPRDRKQLGAYYTPPALAAFLVRWAVRAPSDRVFDPACGEAVFLRATIDRLLELGGDPVPAQVAGCELDPLAASAAARAVPAATVCTSDFFAQEPAGTPFDAIVGNPP
jgi:predicted RNA methylase